MPTQVAIIGAGIAGLTAAEALSRGGFNVVVWDKGARPGGRASSRVREAFEFDHGAQYCSTSSSNRLLETTPGFHPAIAA